jgi:hypothetical protein
MLVQGGCCTEGQHLLGGPRNEVFHKQINLLRNEQVLLPHDADTPVEYHQVLLEPACMHASYSQLAAISTQRRGGMRAVPQRLTAALCMYALCCMHAQHEAKAHMMRHSHKTCAAACSHMHEGPGWVQRLMYFQKLLPSLAPVSIVLLFKCIVVYLKERGRESTLVQPFRAVRKSAVESREKSLVAVVPVDLDGHVQHQALLSHCQPVRLADGGVVRILHELPVRSGCCCPPSQAAVSSSGACHWQ